MIFKIYLAFVIVSLISFVLYFLRINECLADQGLRCVANMSTVKCIIYCFVPLFHIYFGHECYYFGVIANDEEFEGFYNENEEDA